MAFVVEGHVTEIGVPDQLCRQHGSATVRLEWPGGLATFPLAGLADNREFHETLRSRPVQSIHSQEADLAEVFTQLTGRRLT